MSEISYRDAIRKALIDHFSVDRDAVILGEDLIPQGGSFGVHKGLDEMFPGRLLETPIAEGAIVSIALGYAMTGKTAVAEIMFGDFLTCCMDEIVNQAAKIRYMSGGQADTPLVVRAPVGLAKNIGAQHSQTFEAWFAHVPGLVVALPSSPADAGGLLATALASRDPVLFLENKMLYPLKGEMADADYSVPFGSARVARSGDDLSVVALGRMVPFAMDAAETLAGEGFSLEVIDPRTVAPMDFEAIFASVEKTSRALVVEEATGFCSVGAEIAATISECRFMSLDGPVRRISSPHVPKPFTPPLEKLAMPTVEDIVTMARRMLDGQS